MKNKIVVCGSINEDIVLGVSDIVSAGNTIFATDSAVHNGGKGANQAVCAARMNADVHFIGAVGNDGSGHRIVEELQHEGIHTASILIKETQTGFAMIQVDAQGRNAIVVHKGANHALTPQDIDQFEMVLKDASYCLLQFEIPMEVIHYVIDRCEALGVKVILNPAPFVENFDRKYLDKIDLLVPNEHEFMDMMHLKDVTPDTIAAHAKAFYETYQTDIIVTLGVHGSYYHGKQGFHHQKAHKVKAVDTTAAGDSYIGALAAELADGKSYKEAMEFASEVSGITVTKHGAQASIPNRNEL